MIYKPTGENGGGHFQIVLFFPFFFLNKNLMGGAYFQENAVCVGGEWWETLKYQECLKQN